MYIFLYVYVYILRRCDLHAKTYREGDFENTFLYSHTHPVDSMMTWCKYNFTEKRPHSYKLCN